MVVFKKKPLEVLKENGWTQTRLAKEHIIQGNTIKHLRECNENVTLRTIGIVCELADINIEDLIEIKKG